MPITVEVTQRDLEEGDIPGVRGNFRDGLFGPLARAIKRALSANDVCTYGGAVFADGKWYEFSDRVRKFVIDWNGGMDCTPFNFEMTEAEIDPTRSPKDYVSKKTP